MSSDRRICASRANGAKSAGPKTPEGKRRSAKNGVRHGILSRTIVLEGEDTRAFAVLLSSFEAEFEPGTPSEAALIENMAIARWRLMRIWGIEKESFTLEIAKTNAASQPVTRAAQAFRALSDESRSLDLLHRYETRYDRQYARAYYLLHKARSTSAPPAVKAVPTPPNLPDEPSPNIEHRNPSEAPDPAAVVHVSPANQRPAVSPCLRGLLALRPSNLSFAKRTRRPHQQRRRARSSDRRRVNSAERTGFRRTPATCFLQNEPDRPGSDEPRTTNQEPRPSPFPPAIAYHRNYRRTLRFAPVCGIVTGLTPTFGPTRPTRFC